MRIHRPLGLPLAAIVLLAAGCSTKTGPSSSTDGGATGDGTIDPANPTFVLRLEGDDPNRPARVDLIGENLVVDASEETISVDVSIANRGGNELFAPALVRIGSFRPRTVSVANPDFLEIPNFFPNPPPFPWGFDYSEHLGGDGVLEPGEVSAAKTWVFHDPGLVPFSFAARADFGDRPPGGPFIGGVIYHDENRNGRRDPGEGPGPGAVEVVGPDGTGGTSFGSGDVNGRWFVPVELPGLHRVTYFDPTDGPIGWVATTPNPLEVVLPPGPDGDPVSFSGADFGVAPNRIVGVAAPVVMTDRQPDEIDQDPYELVDARLDGDLFKIRVRYGGGCRPTHPLVLHASGDFRESNPVQTWMLLAHDDLGDPCEALIERTVFFDLDPIRQAHIDAYGRPGVVILHFQHFGDTIRFEFGP